MLYIYRSYYPYPRKILQSRERQNDKISNPIVAQTSPHNILSRGFFCTATGFVKSVNLDLFSRSTALVKTNKICRFHGYNKSGTSHCFPNFRFDPCSILGKYLRSVNHFRVFDFELISGVPTFFNSANPKGYCIVFLVHQPPH